VKHLSEVYARARRPSARYWARVIVLLTAVFLAWAFHAELDEVAVATGEVVPQGQVKTIQHLEGGIIKAIHVREGDRVAKDDPLVQLDLTSTGASQEELSVRLDGYLLVAARLKAEATGAEPAFDPVAAERRPDLVKLERERFQAFRNELATTLAVYEERAHQRELEIRQIGTKQDTVANDLRLAQEEFTMSTALLAEGLTSKLDHLKLKREIEKLQGEQTELAGSLPRAKAALSEARKQIRREVARLRRLSSEGLGGVELEITQIREALARATDRVDRLEIHSPIDDIVKSLRYHTIDGVVRAGDAIMDIVPTDENLVVEAKLDPVDVGYVRVGQPAVIKISTYEFVRYGGLDGEVVDLSADSHTDQEGNTYFRLVVRPDKVHFGETAGELPITAGMQATVDVHTGRKTVLRYLLTPVLKLKNESFRER
jgi:adhesin transport system membrane fusion protein